MRMDAMVPLFYCILLSYCYFLKFEILHRNNSLMRSLMHSTILCCKLQEGCKANNLFFSFIHLTMVLTQQVKYSQPGQALSRLRSYGVNSLRYIVLGGNIKIFQRRLHTQNKCRSKYNVPLQLNSTDVICAAG